MHDVRAAQLCAAILKVACELLEPDEEGLICDSSMSSCALRSSICGGGAADTRVVSSGMNATVLSAALASRPQLGMRMRRLARRCQQRTPHTQVDHAPPACAFFGPWLRPASVFGAKPSWQTMRCNPQLCVLTRRCRLVVRE